MTVWTWLKIAIARKLIRGAFRLLRWGLLAVILLLAWPVTLMAGVAFALAWHTGSPPVRLYRLAIGSAALVLLWAALVAVMKGTGQFAALSAGAWAHGWRWCLHARPFGIFRMLLYLWPFAVPAGLGLAGLAWSGRIHRMTTGLGGWSPSARFTFDSRRWKYQVRSASAVNNAPGSVPLLIGDDQIPVGATIRTVGHRWRRVLSVPAAACGRHMVVIGATGMGKTNLMMRLWVGWYKATSRLARLGRCARPLLVVIDCKGGRDARLKAERTRRLLHACGARRVAIWPDEDPVSLWELPPRDLAVLLFQMIDSGTGAAAYYADIMQQVLNLAIMAPAGPPRSAIELLERLEAKWLVRTWGDGRHRNELGWARAAAPHLPDIQLRLATLFGRLGPALDGPGRLSDADAWYFILEGTSEPSVAEAQALAVTELTAWAAVSAADAAAVPRSILLVADDYSAVAGRVPLSHLYERGRSLGIGVQVSAQAWEGLGRDEAERYRIAATADGGVWVLGTPHPEPLCDLAGRRRVMRAARQFAGFAFAGGERGTLYEREDWVADPQLIRGLDVGQACYIHRGAATFVKVARPLPSPLSLLSSRPVPSRPVPVRPAPVPSRPEPPPARPPEPPSGTASLDDVLGPGGPSWP